MGENKIKKVTILILSYNGLSLLKECLDSYLGNEYGNFSVVVIDNGSSDGSKEWIESNYKDVIVLRTEKNLGYSGGFNFGLNYAFKQQSSDYVLITNNDVRADKNVLTELVKVAETDQYIGFVTGKVYYYSKPNMLQTVGKFEDPITWNGEHIGAYEEDKGQYDKIEERIFIDDVFTLVSRLVYETVGGYDTTFRFQAEEYDWQARAKNHGYKIYYTPFARLWHHVSYTIGATSPFKAYYDARNCMIVIMIHKSPVFFKRYFYQHLKGTLKYSIKNLLKLKPLMFIKMWQGFFSALAWGFKNKKLTFRHFA